MRTTLLLSIFLFGCATTTTTPNDADTYIRSAIPRFSTAFNAGNADAVAEFYTDDAAVLPPNAPIAVGKAAVRDTFRSFISGAHPTLNFGSDRIVQSCDVAYEYGHYTMQAGSMTDQGKYVTVWRRQANGDWKIAVDMFNSNLGAPPPR